MGEFGPENIDNITSPVVVNESGIDVLNDWWPPIVSTRLPMRKTAVITTYKESAVEVLRFDYHFGLEDAPKLAYAFDLLSKQYEQILAIHSNLRVRYGSSVIIINELKRQEAQVARDVLIGMMPPAMREVVVSQLVDKPPTHPWS